jgi:hypothetical protein
VTASAYLAIADSAAWFFTEAWLAATLSAFPCGGPPLRSRRQGFPSAHRQIQITPEDSDRDARAPGTLRWTARWRTTPTASSLRSAVVSWRVALMGSADLVRAVS